MATESVREEADDDPLETTWDGLPVAEDLPRGAAVVVRRRTGGPDGPFEYLLLHRALHGPHFEGDWAWTPPSGARQPGEPLFPSALRELQEEAGLTGVDVAAVDLSSGWALYLAEVADQGVTLIDPEHDRYEWAGFEKAVRQCAPETVRENLRRTQPLPSVAVAFARRTGQEGVQHTLSVDGVEQGAFTHFPRPSTDDGSWSADLRWDVGPAVGAAPWLLTRALWCFARDVLTAHQPPLARVFTRPGSAAQARCAEAAGFTSGAGRDGLYMLDMQRVFGR